MMAATLTVLSLKPNQDAMLPYRQSHPVTDSKFPAHPAHFLASGAVGSNSNVHAAKIV
jgi:hypothetical protein